MENKMNCKDYEEKILEVLDRKELPSKILSHVNKCKDCFKFYNYIVALKRNFSGMEVLEPSADFDMRVIEKLREEPAYLQVLAFVNSFAVFFGVIFTALFVRRYFTGIVLFCGKALKILGVLSGTFSYGSHTVVILSFLAVALFVVASGVFDVFLLSKLIKNGGKS